MIGVLLINLGTPAAPEVPAVRRYLREFLMDPRVIDIDAFSRWLLVNFLIVPFRAPKSTRAYRMIWTREGSPLLVNTRALGRAVAAQLGENYSVEIAMRYGQPSIEAAMRKLIGRGVSTIRVLPLYPQYADSSTGSTQAKVHEVAKRLPGVPSVQFLLPFFDHPGFIQAFAEIGRPQLAKFRPDHVLFSFHGLPVRQILKEDVGGQHCLKSPECCDEIIPANGLCYRAHCFQTARALAKELQLGPEDFSVSFQSRLGRTPWIQPFTDLRIPELIKEGKRRLAVFCPAFVADCLETLEEIGIRAHDQAKDLGGDLLLIPSLNAHPTWVQTVSAMIQGK